MSFLLESVCCDHQIKNSYHHNQQENGINRFNCVLSEHIVEAVFEKSTENFHAYKTDHECKQEIFKLEVSQEIISV